MRRPADYNATFDYGRLVAVCGIIWFHAKAPGAVIGYAGLAFFVMLLVQNALSQIATVRPQFHRAPAWVRYAAARAERLLFPWLLACIVYGSFKVVEVAGGSPWSFEFTPYMWLTGTALHLWFLPFAFLICLAFWPLGRWLRDQPPQVCSGVAFFCAGTALLLFNVVQVVGLPVPFAQWAYALPSVLLGVTFALERQNVTQTLGLLTFFCLTALALDLTTGLLEIAIAGAALALCSNLHLPSTGLSRWCGRVSLWVYLVHPIAMTIIVRGIGVPDGSVLLAVLTTATTLLIVGLSQALGGSRLHRFALNS